MLAACSLPDGSGKVACAVDGDCNPGRYCSGANVCVDGIEAVALGYRNTCALRQGRVQCWGNNSYGQSGGTGPEVWLPLLPGTRLTDVLGEPAATVDGGYLHTCARTAAGKAVCFGDNRAGQLGVGPDATSPAVCDLGASYRALSVVTAGDTNCAILEGGGVKCWGINESGELGTGDTRNRGDMPDQMGDNLPFVQLGAGHTAKQLAVGDSHVCALLDDNQVTCWGANWAAQLGFEDNVMRGDAMHPLGAVTELVRLGTGVRPLSLASGGNHTCALLPGGLVKCWGANGSGQLGIGDPGGSWGDVPGEMGDNLPLVNLGAGRRAVQLAVGGTHTCALLDDATVKCWGLNDAGQLGLDTRVNVGGRPEDMGDALPPVNLGTGRTALAIAAGNQHTCAILDNHKLKCWGLNDDGQLGLDARDNNRGDGLAADGTTPAAEMGDNLPFVDIGP